MLGDEDVPRFIDFMLKHRLSATGFHVLGSLLVEPFKHDHSPALNLWTDSEAQTEATIQFLQQDLGFTRKSSHRELEDLITATQGQSFTRRRLKQRCKIVVRHGAPVLHPILQMRVQFNGATVQAPSFPRSPQYIELDELPAVTNDLWELVCEELNDLLDTGFRWTSGAERFFSAVHAVLQPLNDHDSIAAEVSRAGLSFRILGAALQTKIAYVSTPSLVEVQITTHDDPTVRRVVLWKAAESGAVEARIQVQQVLSANGTNAALFSKLSAFFNALKREISLATVHTVQDGVSVVTSNVEALTRLDPQGKRFSVQGETLTQKLDEAWQPAPLPGHVDHWFSNTMMQRPRPHKIRLAVKLEVGNMSKRYVLFESKPEWPWAPEDPSDEPRSDQNVSLDYVASLSETEKRALRQWSRMEVHFRTTVEVQYALQRHLITQIFLRAPRLTQPLEVYRGWQLNSVKDIDPNRAGFLATSLSRDSATEFMRGKCCLTRIIVPVGTPVLLLQGISRMPWEAEVLLPSAWQLQPLERENQYAYIPSPAFTSGRALNTALRSSMHILSRLVSTRRNHIINSIISTQMPSEVVRDAVKELRTRLEKMLLDVAPLKLRGDGLLAEVRFTYALLFGVSALDSPEHISFRMQWLFQQAIEDVSVEAQVHLQLACEVAELSGDADLKQICGYWRSAS